MLNTQAIEARALNSNPLSNGWATKTETTSPATARSQLVQRRATGSARTRDAHTTASAHEHLAPRTDQQDRRLGALMKAAQDGDSSAYEGLLRECIPFIKMVTRRHGAPADLTDDVVQETLLTIHRARHTFDPSRSFGAWLRTIAHRRTIDVVRSQYRNARREIYEPLALENHSDPAGSPADAAEKADDKSFLGVAVAALPARQREAVEQLALNGRMLADAAVATGLTMGALKVNFHRALKTLRARISAENRINCCN